MQKFKCEFESDMAPLRKAFLLAALQCSVGGDIMADLVSMGHVFIIERLRKATICLASTDKLSI